MNLKKVQCIENKKRNISSMAIQIIIALVFLFFSSYDIGYSYSNSKTHPGITRIALEIEDPKLTEYLKLFGFNDGLKTEFTFDPESSYAQEIPSRSLSDGWLIH